MGVLKETGIVVGRVCVAPLFSFNHIIFIVLEATDQMQ
jgi:hypothetical protein